MDNQSEKYSTYWVEYKDYDCILADDIFAGPPKPKRMETKKPSFDALLDDDSELFSDIQNNEKIVSNDVKKYIYIPDY